MLLIITIISPIKPTRNIPKVSITVTDSYDIAGITPFSQVKRLPSFRKQPLKREKIRTAYRNVLARIIRLEGFLVKLKKIYQTKNFFARNII